MVGLSGSSDTMTVMEGLQYVQIVCIFQTQSHVARPWQNTRSTNIRQPTRPLVRGHSTMNGAPSLTPEGLIRLVDILTLGRITAGIKKSGCEQRGAWVNQDF